MGERDPNGRINESGMFSGLSISRAGEPDFFTGYQLLYFRGETRKNEQMVAVARDLTDDDIRDLGAYYASLPGPPAPTDPDPDPALTKEGAALVKDRHCVQCHLNTFVGQGEIGRLAGQHEEAIVNALHDYQHGARRGRGTSSCRRSPIL